MATLLNMAWKIQKSTEVSPSPLLSGTTLKIIPHPTSPTPAVQVTDNATSRILAEGEHNSTQTMVTAYPPRSGNNEYWELVLSEDVTGKFSLYGISWKTTQPDAMGAWVCDPQT